MTQKRSGTPRLGTPTLTASDWAEAALQLIAEKGLRALTVDTLASRLGVTKGSFYWHFRGRSELLEAALERWERQTTTETMRALDAIEDRRRRLEVILTAAARPPRSRSLYAALAEAAEDPIVRAVLNRVASVRIKYLESIYRDLGLPPAEAGARAALAYASYRGLLQLAHEAPEALPPDWSIYPNIILSALVPPVEGQRPARSGGALRAAETKNEMKGSRGRASR